MRTIPLAVLALTAPLASLPALADGVSLTIYNEDLAMVRDSRTIAFPAGTGAIAFDGVSARIRPETAALRADGVRVEEQNFDFDLISPPKLLEKAVGKTVTILRLNPATGKEEATRATVLAANGEPLFLIDGRIETLGGGARVAFDSLPETLKSRPTLSMRVASARAGSRPARLTYLTGGLGWNADYVGQYDEARGLMNLQGWVTIRNQSGTDFVNARTQVVAGDVNQATREIMVTAYRKDAMAMPAPPAEPEREAVGDYHLYTLPTPLTLTNNQTKQVALLHAAAVKAARSYRYEAHGFSTQEQPQNVEVRVRFANTAANGLGQPLPGGVVRLYGQDKAGESQFLGEDSIAHTPDGNTVDLTLGRAFDVTVQSLLEGRRIVARDDNGQTVEWSMVYTLRNRKDAATTVDLRQSGLYGDWQLLGESLKHEKLDADTIGWQVPVPAKGETVVKFTLRQRN